MSESLTRQKLLDAVAKALYEVTRDPDRITPRDIAQTALAVVEGAIRADERERIAQAWQIKDWPLITKQVKAGSVIGVAQAVTDWLRNGGSVPNDWPDRNGARE